MPLMNLLQKVQPDEKTPVKHKKLLQSDEETDDSVSPRLLYCTAHPF